MRLEFEQIGVASTLLASRLPYPVIIAIADSLSQCGSLPRSTLRQIVLQRVPTPNFRDLTVEFLDQWESSGSSLGSESLALSLLTAAHSERAHRSHESVELVWTGPEPANSRFRQTEQAILEIINSARHQLTVVSYAVYRIPRIREALISAAHRGVKIRLIIETPNRIEGQGEYDCLRALGETVASVCSVYFWPQENRSKDDNGKVGILHVKCAIADRCRMFVSSANFTDYAFTINMELGLLVSSEKLPAQVDNHFDALIAQACLLQI